MALRRLAAGLPLAALLLPSPSHAEGRVAVLVSEGRLAGPARFWWHCGADTQSPLGGGPADPQPFVDGLASELRASGNEPIVRCTGPIHDTFARPDLGARAAANVGSVLEADAVLWGSVSYTIEAPIGSLGLRHVHADARLGQLNVESGKVTWEGHFAVDGYAADLASAHARARSLLLAEASTAVRAVGTEAPSNVPPLVVELAGGGATEKRLLSLEALKRIPGVTSVRLIGVALDRTVFELVPASARYTVAAVLAKANVKYRFVDAD